MTAINLHYELCMPHALIVFRMMVAYCYVCTDVMCYVVCVCSVNRSNNHCIFVIIRINDHVVSDSKRR